MGLYVIKLLYAIIIYICKLIFYLDFVITKYYIKMFALIIISFFHSILYLVICDKFIIQIPI